MKPVSILPLTLILLLFAGCTLDAGVERASTPEPDLTATALAATSAAQAERLAALEQTVAEQATRVAALESTMATPVPAPEPDLGWLAYVQGGDIWVRALPDGEAQRLTADGRNREPRWSPSGSWLSFRKDSTLWLMRADGTGARPLYDAGEAVWSPTDDRLAYVPWDRWGLYLLDPEALANTDDSGAGRLVYAAELPEGQYVQVRGLSWRLDGGALAFGLSTWAEEQPLASAVWLVEAAPDAGEPWRLFDLGDPATGLRPAAWGPWNEGLLILRDAGYDDNLADEIPIFASSSGTTFELPVPLQVGTAFVSRAPDGGALALILGAGKTTWENKRLTIFYPAESDLWELTGDDTVVVAPNFAPGGDRLAYVAMPANNDLLERRIWVRDFDSDLPRQLTGDPLYRDEYPLWSADGAEILFLRMTRDGRVSVWSIAAAGGTPRRLVDELTPAPDWFAAEGTPDWGELISWWPGAAPVTAP